MISISTFCRPFWNPDPFCSQYCLAPKKSTWGIFFMGIPLAVPCPLPLFEVRFLLAAGWLVSFWKCSLYASSHDGKVFLQLLSLAKTGGNGISQSKWQSIMAFQVTFGQNCPHRKYWWQLMAISQFPVGHRFERCFTKGHHPFPSWRCADFPFWPRQQHESLSVGNPL